MLEKLIPAAYAQVITNPVIQGSGQGGKEAGGTIVGKIISATIGFLFIIGAIFAFLNLIVGGMAWISASGDKQKLENAQQRITQAIIGLVILAAAWALMTLVSAFTGIRFPNLDVPTIQNL